MPPTTPGSMGDAAMISAVISHLRTRETAGIDLLYDGHWPLDGQPDRYIPASRFFYENNQAQKSAVYEALHQHSEILFIGADTIDGAYNPRAVRNRLSLLRDFVLSGRKARILGASYNAKPEQTTRNALAKLPPATVVCARDPQSLSRLRSVFGSVVQTADLAFCVEPREDHPDAMKALSWVASRRGSRNEIIAINCNALQFKKKPGLATSYARMIEQLVEDNISILLVPHDTRTAEPDVFHLRKAISGLSPTQLSSTYLIETDSPGALKATLARCDLLFSGRLHAMILAMGAGTPAMGLAYQDKFEGMFELFGMPTDDILIAPEVFEADPPRVIEQLRRNLQRCADLRDQVCAGLPQVLELSRRNFG